MIKILHIDFSAPYSEDTTYQENLLPAAMAKAGNRVFMWTPCYKWDKGVIVKTNEGVKKLENEVILHRFKFKYFFNDFFTRKIRKVDGLYKQLCRLDPDVIMLHSIQTLSALDICEYIRRHPEKAFVADTHSDHHNSARGILSKYILHRIIYRHVARKVQNCVKYLYYITEETKDFVIKEYGLDKEKLKFLPLGGNLLSEYEYQKLRSKIRMELGIEEETLLFLHTGKLDKLKKTDTLLRAFSKADRKNIRLIILGSCDKEMESIIQSKLKDKKNSQRITYLGWKNGEELLQFLCGADVYVQPGGQSATFQNAICCRCALICYPHKSYLESFIDGNAILASDEKELLDAINFLADNPGQVKVMSKKSGELAAEKLDYGKQGEMILQDAGCL